MDYNGTDKDLKKLAGGLDKSNDNRIIAIAKKLKEVYGNKGFSKISIISKDTGLRIKGNAFGITTEDYQADKSLEKLSDIYSGIGEIEIGDEDLWVFDELSRNGAVEINRLLTIDLSSLLPNQCCEIKKADKKIYAIYKHRDGCLHRVKKPKDDGKNNGKIHPSNIEQCLAYNLLIDREIALVTLIGKAGTGKTLMALLAGYEQLSNNYAHLLVYRPNIEIGPGLGFLPGDIEEKFEPWSQPIFDNLRLIIKDKGGNGTGKPEVDQKMNADTEKIRHMIEYGLIEIAPIAYIRGRSLNDSFIVIDDAQNLSPREIKALLTRPARNSKVVLTGDPAQIDAPYLDSISNGIVYVVEKFKGQDIFGHVIFKEGKRSRLADLAANLL